MLLCFTFIFYFISFHLLYLFYFTLPISFYVIHLSIYLPFIYFVYWTLSYFIVCYFILYKSITFHCVLFHINVLYFVLFLFYLFCVFCSIFISSCLILYQLDRSPYVIPLYLSFVILLYFIHHVILFPLRYLFYLIYII